MTPSEAAERIEDERRQQDAKHGGPAHDDTHLPSEWRWFIAQHTAKAIQALTHGEQDVAEQAILEVAGLGWAVSEVLQRRAR